MELSTISQVYLLPAGTQTIQDAANILDMLGLKYEAPLLLNRLGDYLIQISVMVPVIPVVHYYSLHELRKDFIQKRSERVNRPSHTEAQEWSYALPVEEAAYPDEFFSLATQQKLAFATTELIVREHIVAHFAAQSIKIKKITFNKPANHALDSVSVFNRNRDSSWFALVEEARPVVENLAGLLGAIQ